MKRSLKALSWAAACWLMSSQAQAQSPDAVTSIHLPAATPVAYHAKLGADCAAPSCEAPACGAPACCDAGCGEAGCGCATNSCCSSGCGSCGGLSSIFGCCTADPWTLKSANGFNYGGWVQVGWQDRVDGAFNGNGFAPTQVTEAGGVRLNQLYSFVEKVADGSCGLDWGLRFDAMYGVDGNEAQAFGNVNADYWDYRNGFGGPFDTVQHGPYEIALPQAYGQVALGNLSTKIGHFYTPIGYELVTSPGNFFLSRQLTFYNSEPFTHTGAYSTYTVNEKFNFSGGWTQGMDTGFYQYNNGNSYLGGYTWVASDFLTINHYFIFGNLGWRGHGGISSFIASLAWTDKVSTVHQFDFLGSDATESDVLNNGVATPATIGGPAAVPRDSTGFINYLFYQVNDCVKAGTRLEWYKADGDSYYTWTNGVNFKLGPNMVLRPEARYMWSNTTTTSPIFANGDRMVWGCDWIFTF